MKVPIVVTTYSGHSEQIHRLYESIQKYNTGSEVELILVLTDGDYEFANDIPCKKVSLNHLLEKYANVSIDESWLLAHCGKYSYQTIKKLYGALYATEEYEYCVTIDSENELVKSVDVNKLLSDIIAKKEIYFWPNCILDVQHEVNSNSGIILGKNFDEWFFETPYVFYNRDIIRELMMQEGFYQKLLDHKSTFESVIYNGFIFVNNDKYNYKFTNNKNLIKTWMGEEFVNRLNAGGSTGEYLFFGKPVSLQDACRMYIACSRKIASLYKASNEDVEFIIENSPLCIVTHRFEK